MNIFNTLGDVAGAINNPIGFIANQAGNAVTQIGNALQGGQYQPPQSTQNQTNQTNVNPRHLFTDEKAAYSKMIIDGLDDTKANAIITQNRKNLLGEITQEEGKALLQMQQDGLDTKKAVDIVKQNRSNNMPLWKKALKVPFDLSVATVAGGVGELGGFTDAITGGNSLSQDAMNARTQVQGRNDSIASQAGDLLGSGIVDYYAGKVIGKTPLGKGKTVGNIFDNMGLVGQAAVGGAGFGAATAIGQEGSNVTGEQIATNAAIGGVGGAVLGKVAPSVINKSIKYGKATLKGGVEGLGKSVSRDVTRPFRKISKEGLAPTKGAEISTKVNRFTSKQEKDFKKMTGQSSGEFATSRGLTETGDKQLEKTVSLYQQSMKEADKGLELVNGLHKINKGPDFVKGMFEDLNKKLSEFNPKIKIVRGLEKKYNTTGLSMTEVNTLKRLYAKNHKYNFLDGASSAAIRSRDLQDGVRKWQFDIAKKGGFKNLDEINKNTQAFKTYSDNLAQSLGRSNTNNAISLTDWVALSGGNPSNIALFGGKKALQHPYIKSKIIQGLTKKTKEPLLRANRLSIKTATKKQKAKILIDRVKKDITPSKTKLLPVGKTKTIIKTNITPSKKPIILKAKVNKPKISTTPSKGAKPIVATKKVIQPKKPLLLNKGVRVTPQTIKQGEKLTQQIADKKVITKSKQDLKNTKFGNNKTISGEATNYKLAKILYNEAVTEKELLALKSDIKNINLARKNELNKLIDDKISVLKTLNKVNNNADTIKQHYGNKLFTSFKRVFADENRVIKTKSGDKYSKIEFLNSKNAKTLNVDIQEFLQNNPWDNRTVQEVYDGLKELINKTSGKYNTKGFINPQIIIDDLKKLPKTTMLQADKIAKNITNNIVKSLGVAKESYQVVLKIVKQYIKKHGVELKNKLGDLMDKIADKTGARLKFVDEIQNKSNNNKIVNITSIDDKNLIRNYFYGKQERNKLIEHHQQYIKPLKLKYPTLTDNEILSVYLYRQNEYFGLNKVLRSGKQTNRQELSYKKFIDNALQKIPNYKGIVYREGRLPSNIVDKLEVGSIFKDKGFMSTSTDKTITKEFKVFGGMNTYSVQYKLKTKTGKAIDDFGGIAEDEILIQPNTGFKITKYKINKNKGSLIIEGYEI